MLNDLAWARCWVKERLIDNNLSGLELVIAFLSRDILLMGQKTWSSHQMIFLKQTSACETSY